MDTHYKSAFAKLMTLGILIATLFVIIGGILYLREHGNELIQYKNFHGEPQQLTSLSKTFSAALHFSSLALIQLGLIILVFVQILRVGLTLIYFIGQKDKIFILITLFILGILLFSFFK